MQTLAPPRGKAFYGSDAQALTYDGHAIVRDATAGTATITGFPVFKAGTFRDSMGEQRTWTTEQLHQIVSNFNLLKDRGIFPNVPVRSDHSYSVDKVIGYFDALSVSDDGQFLLADYTVTEPPAADKIERGTYRSRSMEVGLFESNGGEMDFPVAFGFAFVDIPAVEGLHAKNAAVSYFSATATDNKESTMPTENDDRGATKPEVTANATVSGSVLPMSGTATFSTGASTSGTVITMTPAPAVHTFRVNGGDVTDVAAVQAHIDSLELFASETRDGNRKAFVNGLVEAKKLAAPQAEAMSDLVVSMTAEQFEKFKASYEAAPVLSVLASHGATTTAPAGETTAADDQLAVLEATIAQHKRAGLTDDQIAKTSSFKKLAALTASKS